MSPPPDAAAMQALQEDLAAARSRLRELEYTLEAIQTGKADALLIQGPRGEQVFTLKSLDVLIDSIVEHSLGATVLLDAAGTVLRSSAAAAELAQGDPRGRPFDEAFPLLLVDGPDAALPGSDAGARPPGGRFSAASVLAGSAYAGQEVRLDRRDGAVFHLLMAAKPLAAFGGMFSGAVVSLLDITARKRAEVQLEVRTKQLRYQFELTKTITDTTAEALFLTDTGGYILFVNPAAARLLGRTPAELMGRHFHHAAHPHHAADGEAAEACPLGRLTAALGMPAAGSQDAAQNEDEFTAAGGAKVAVRRSLVPVISDGQVTGMVASVADISRHKQAEAALRLSEEKLRQSQKMEAVGRLAGGIAHDFNNLLTAINGYSALALETLDPDAALRFYLEEIHKSGERAASLTSQLLAYSRKQILSFKVLDMSRLAAETMEILRRTLGENLRYTLELPPRPLRVRADPARIQQVLVNVAINSRDAMPEGGELRLSAAAVTVAAPDRSGLLGEMAREPDEGLAPGEYVRVSVSDDGHGMDAKVKTHLFEPFFTTKEVGKGTGLGLSMAYGIMKQSQGHIQVFSGPESGPDGRPGTTVHLYLPLVREEAGAEALAASSPARSRGSETVLLAEDEAAVRGLIRKVLQDNGYRVLEAASGQEALALSDAHPGTIDLLITDMVMNGMGGHELAAALRDRRPGTRQIFISGYTEDFSRKIGAGPGEAVFLQKPFSPDTLVRTARGLLDRATASPPG